MGTTPDRPTEEKQSTEFRLFAAKRILLGVIGVVVLLWLVSYALRFFDKPESPTAAPTPHLTDGAAASGQLPPETPGDAEVVAPITALDTTVHSSDADAGHEAAAEAARPPAAASLDTAEALAPPPAEDHGTQAPVETVPGTPEHGTAQASAIRGVAFVNAMMAPMHYELNERFLGWRPNDIIEFTDNVNNYQLGVLELTRRTAEILADRISRTGSTQAFEKGLERVRSNFNINANQYLLPSAESSYGEALEVLVEYRQKLMDGTAYFYNRTDNLIPLLRAYENLLGSCDDNLVKTHEDDGAEVSWFKADNYFFYAQGVAASMHSVLEAVGVDFSEIIESRRGSEVLHHAIESLHHATQIDPFIILDSAPDGILANHRANLAAHISHARFYIGLLIETLST